jgi:hypothetical protein
MTAVIRPAEWVDFVRREYLEGFIRDGGAAVKFCVPLEETARAATWNALSLMGQQLGYIVIKIDAATTKVNLIDQIFFHIADQLDWPMLVEAVMKKLCQRECYQPPEVGQAPFFQRVADKNGVSSDLVRMDLRRALDKEVLKRGDLTKDFRVAMTHLCRAQLSDSDEGQAITRTITDWLTGKTRSVAPLRPYLIFNRVTRSNARRLLESLLRWITIAGYPGTLLLIDLARLAVARNPLDGKPYYTAGNLLEAFEVLREFVDSTDRLAHCLIMAFPEASFVDETSGRGMAKYWALNIRISDEVRARELVNPLAALVRLSTSAPEVRL